MNDRDFVKAEPITLNLSRYEFDLIVKALEDQDTLEATALATFLRRLVGA